MRKILALAFVLTLSFTGLAPSSHALEYIRLSGVVQNASVNPHSAVVRLWLQGQKGGNVLADVEIKGGRGNYSVLVPKNTPVEIGLFSWWNGYSGTAGWGTSATYSQDTELNFNIPLGIKISGRIVDAQGKPISNGLVSSSQDFFDVGGMDPIQISGDGNLWKGSGQRQVNLPTDSTGNFEFYLYSTKNVGSKIYLVVEGIGSPGYRWVSPKFVIDGPKEFVVCLPMNFDSTATLPKYCSEDEVAYAARAAADKAAAEKAARDKAAADKAAADKAAADARAAALKKTTITCTKGKLIKKVTSVNPKCPAGYKKK